MLSLYTADRSVRVHIYTCIEDALLKDKSYSRRVLQDKLPECTFWSSAQHLRGKHKSRRSEHLIISIDLPESAGGQLREV